jgi:hypothetical protein
VSEDGLTVDRRPGTLWRKMAHRRRPLYEDQDARISILANGVMLKGRIRLCRLPHAHRHKPLADGAGHTFAPPAERWALMCMLSIEAVTPPIRPVEPVRA